MFKRIRNRRYNSTPSEPVFHDTKNMRGMFLSDMNVAIVISKVKKELREQSAVLNEDLFPIMKMWYDSRQEFPVNLDPFDNLSELNDTFVKKYVRSVITTDFNPFRDRISGKKISHMSAEDMKNLDLWKEAPMFITPENQKINSVKGIHNPHIIGAHRRHYDMQEHNLVDAENFFADVEIRGYRHEHQPPLLVLAESEEFRP